MSAQLSAYKDGYMDARAELRALYAEAVETRDRVRAEANRLVEENRRLKAELATVIEEREREPALKSYFNDVRAFHEKFSCAIGERPAVQLEQFRISLVMEELTELIKAHGLRATSYSFSGGSTVAFGYDRFEEPDLAGIADGIADLIYVLCGMAVTYGIPLDRVWSEVHAANMRKVGGGERADGKILKPEGWVGPDIIGAINGEAA
jgi:predicted HAD superfamily Cof-like phosphohydrolase